MPDINSGCPMADMADSEELLKLKKNYPGAVIVSYVNTTASIKALSDICCTSANAVKVVQAIDKNSEIIFVPDKYLGQYAINQTGRKMILWDGYCPVHVKILAEDVIMQKKKYPDAEVLAHPESTPEIIEIADKVLSTSGMCRYVKESGIKEFIIGTENGLIYRLQKENPGKKFYPVSEQAVCENMKLNSLEKVLWALEDMKEEVKVPEEIRKDAIRSVNKMLQVC
jgi:quinolinate synthase